MPCFSRNQGRESNPNGRDRHEKVRRTFEKGAVQAAGKMTGDGWEIRMTRRNKDVVMLKIWGMGQARASACAKLLVWSMNLPLGGR